MKTFHKLSTMILGLALLASSAQANNHRHIEAVAQLTISNVWPEAYFTTVTIYGDGHVTTHSNKTERKVIALLEPVVLDNIATAIENVTAGDLADIEPNMPSCMDAPTHTYSVYKNGEEIHTRQIMGCKAYDNQNAWSANGINELLSAFSTIAH